MLVEEETYGEEAGAGIVENCGEEVAFGRVEDECRDGGMDGGEVGCEGGSEAGSVGDDLLGGDGAGGGEVVPGGVGVLGHLALIGMGVGAVAVASIVEGEDVKAEIVETVERGIEVGECTIAAWKEEDADIGVACPRGGGKPDAGELRSGGLIGAEVDPGVFSALRLCGGSPGVENQLPLTLIEEQAEGDISADKSGEDGEGYGLEEPDMTDSLRW